MAERGEVITTSISKQWIDDSGIAHLVYLPNAPLTPETLNEQYAIARKSCEGKAMPVLVDIRQIGPNNREARKVMASDEVTKITKASAVLVGSLTSQVVANLYIGIYRPPYPCKMFRHESDALEWLKQFTG